MRGIRRDRYGYRVYVRVHGQQREKRFPPEASLKIMQAWRDEARVALRAATPANPRGTVRKDVARYLAKTSIKGLAEYGSRRSHLAAWVTLYGDRPRARIGRTEVLAARDRWLADDYAPKTVHHRIRVWQQLCHELDGSRVPTPCDDVQKPKSPAAAPTFVTAVRIRRVAARLASRPFEQGVFLVLTSTGQRPAQLKRTQMTEETQDVDLRRRVWWVRPAKGGNPIPLFLNDDMLAAWRQLLAVRKAGPAPFTFDTSDYDKHLYAAGWPKSVRPYNAKHSVGFALAEAGAEWQDIQDFFGWKDGKTAKIYTGMVAKRLKGASERLSGRLDYGGLKGEGKLAVTAGSRSRGR